MSGYYDRQAPSQVVCFEKTWNLEGGLAATQYYQCPLNLSEIDGNWNIDSLLNFLGDFYWRPQRQSVLLVVHH